MSSSIVYHRPIEWVIDIRLFRLCSNGVALFIHNKKTDQLVVCIDDVKVYSDAFNQDKFERFYHDADLKTTLKNLYNI